MGMAHQLSQSSSSSQFIGGANPRTIETQVRPNAIGRMERAGKRTERVVATVATEVHEVVRGATTETVRTETERPAIAMLLPSE